MSSLSAFWPYEEVEFSVINLTKGQFIIHTPWITSQFEVPPSSPQSQALLAWIEKKENIDPKNLPALWQVLSGLQSLPIAYELPRRQKQFGKDQHKSIKTFSTTSPQVLAKELEVPFPEIFPQEWTWDSHSILEFCECIEKLYDPLSILSVARRFHYLDDSENKMNDIYTFIENIKDENAKKMSAATVVRQNHYVTEKCLTSLQPAIDISQSQRELVERFMQEEQGHDLILGSGLKTMNMNIQDIPLTESVQNLMHLLERIASHNFLAFCISLDFFEKPQFKDQDSLSEVLVKINEATASRAMQAHKNINDHGKHEGFSRALLLNMNAVEEPYVVQALYLAELVSKSIISVSHDLARLIIK